MTKSPSPEPHVQGPEFTDWERKQLLQTASVNALTFMEHHARGHLRPHEIEEMDRWKALAEKLKPATAAEVSK